MYRLKINGLAIYILPLTGKPEQMRFTLRNGILTGNDTGGAAQVATAHCQNERTLDPAVCSYNHSLATKRSEKCKQTAEITSQESKTQVVLYSAPPVAQSGHRKYIRLKRCKVNEQ